MKRGSALLIVLGMLSFMVVSAVGFSVYMRQGRLPSSYLRRNVSSRYLVKAALANAIEELDCGWMSKYEIGEDDDDSNPNMGRMFGIYDDPYPGCGPDSSRSNMQGGRRQFFGRNVQYCENGDFWFKRVFCPFGLLPYPTSETRAVDEPPITAPTLTTEALAYLPTALIDDVRKVSRLTRTAVWRSLPYEAGRYAYTAVNVSDLFDINRLRAGEPRDSGPNRITLSTLTSSDPADPAAVDQGRADALDNIIDPDQNAKLKVGGQVVPFVSLADFGVSAIGSQYAPLMSYFGGGSQTLFNGGTTPEHANSLFITDTWFPPTNSTGMASFDLASVQPFKHYNANSWLETWTSAANTEMDANGIGTIKDILSANLGIGMACLYDYLDSGNEPCSLALPTTEAVPMIVGVTAPRGLQPVFGPIGTAVPGTFTVGAIDINGDPTQVTVTRTCQQMGFTSFGNNVFVRCLAAYPFKRMFTTKRIKSGDFKVRGILRLWMAPAGMGCRPNTLTSLYPYSNDIQTRTTGSAGFAKDGVATFVTSSFMSGQSLNCSFLAADVNKSEDAEDVFNLQFQNMSISMPVYWNITEEPSPTGANGNSATPNPGTFMANYQSLATMNTQADSLRPLDVDGAIDGNWTTAASAAVFNPNNPYPGGITALSAPVGTYRLYAAVWIQVLNRNDKVVDMVPACLMDDREWLGSSINPTGAFNLKCGTGVPLLNFQNDTDFTFDGTLQTQFATPPSFSTADQLFAVDPRFNFAPEDWFSQSSGGSATLAKGDWFNAIKNGNLLGKLATDRDGFQYVRDRDIFMFVSDQEYLQSIGELQFLPVLELMDGSGGFLNGAYAPTFNGNAHSTRTSPTTGTFANSDRFWRSYYGYKNGTLQDLIYDNPYEMKTANKKPVSFVSGATDFRLNPFSKDLRVLSAATVCTPFDYYVASTNDNQTQDNETKTRKTSLMNAISSLQVMKTTYSFGDSQIAHFSADDMADINDEIATKFEDYIDTFNWNGRAQPSWETAWNKLEWQNPVDGAVNEQNSQFLGLNMNANANGSSYLHGVDRKFLYSFWRECFGNRQQLFLIFVRAEPASVGGGAAGSISSAQLGGRAVALVWRDPATPVDTSGSRVARRSSVIDRENFRRDYKQRHPPHRTRVLFYHQFD